MSLERSAISIAIGHRGRRPRSRARGEEGIARDQVAGATTASSDINDVHASSGAHAARPAGRPPPPRPAGLEARLVQRVQESQAAAARKRQRRAQRRLVVNSG